MGIYNVLALTTCTCILYESFLKVFLNMRRSFCCWRRRLSDDGIEDIDVCSLCCVRIRIFEFYHRVVRGVRFERPVIRVLRVSKICAAQKLELQKLDAEQLPTSSI